MRIGTGDRDRDRDGDRDRDSDRDGDGDRDRCRLWTSDRVGDRARAGMMVVQGRLGLASCASYP